MNYATATIADFIEQDREARMNDGIATYVPKPGETVDYEPKPITIALWRVVDPMPPLPTPPDTRPHLTACPVCCEADALIMGRIRHIQRAGFSADNSAIDEDRQRAWYAEMRNRLNAYLYRDGDGNAVGFGALIQQDSGTWVSSVAVLPEFGGRGYGRAITHHLVTSVRHEVYARALLSNPAACALHNALDWEVTDEDDTCRYFRTRPKIRTAHSLNAEDYR